MQGFNVGMVAGFGQDFCNHPALFGNAQAPLGAECFNVDGLVHELLVHKKKRPADHRPAGRFFNCA